MFSPLSWAEEYKNSRILLERLKEAQKMEATAAFTACFQFPHNLWKLLHKIYYELGSCRGKLLYVASPPLSWRLLQDNQIHMNAVKPNANQSQSLWRHDKRPHLSTHPSCLFRCLSQAPNAKEEGKVCSTQLPSLAWYCNFLLLPFPLSPLITNLHFSTQIVN